MRSLTYRVTSRVVYVCALFAVLAGALGYLGVRGVRSATDAGAVIAKDELTTSNVTAQFAHDIDAVFAAGRAAAATTELTQRARLLGELRRAVPTAETALGALQRIHADDATEELAGIDQLSQQWAVLRDAATAASAPGAAQAITAAYRPLDAHLAALIAREAGDSAEDQAAASDSADATTFGIALVVAATVCVAAGIAFIGGRRLHTTLKPEQGQTEFANTLQLAEDEDEAHHLLQRHLERAVTDGTVVVLNRNNSADRLEAVTELSADSPLADTLAHAEPRSCLAVRSGQTHVEDTNHPSLLACAVCAPCPGRSSCTPLTVGGEVIGAVLVNRRERFSPLEDKRIRDSVGQAAPVLANLRNLAIAELRAATDSLTGLPNKRAVGDTVKRMLAQAARADTPLSLLLLDLDHFKQINDRYGHPVGDQALANVGQALRSSLREGDFAGRNGGEEFVVVLPDTGVAGAMVAAEKIRAAIAEVTLTGLDVRITASVGISAYPDHAASTERLERLADSALYVAKRSGRDRIEVAAPTPDKTPALHPVSALTDSADAG